VRAAYIITGNEGESTRVMQAVARDWPSCVASSAPDAMSLERGMKIRQYEYLKMSLESVDSLRDEWYDDDPIFQRLFASPFFGGQSSALYLTMSHSQEESKLFADVLSSIVNACIDAQVYDCLDLQLPVDAFLQRIRDKP